MVDDRMGGDKNRNPGRCSCLLSHECADDRPPPAYVVGVYEITRPRETTLIGRQAEGGALIDGRTVVLQRVRESWPTIISQRVKLGIERRPHRSDLILASIRVADAGHSRGHSNQIVRTGSDN